MKKIILLNGGVETRKSFSSGVKNTPLEFFSTKKMILHLKGFSLSFQYAGSEINFENSYVFTRLRSHDEVFCGIIYEHLEALGVPGADKINISFAFSGEKIAQMARLVRAKVPIPETIIAREESFENNREYIEKNIHFPLVYKTDGNKGESVFLIQTMQELEEKINSKTPGELFLLQEVIPNTFDTRTLVAYGQVLGSIKRSAQNGEFLNNVSQGADVDTFELSQDEKDLAVRATTASGLDFGGVDIIHTNNGPFVIEVNKAPQIKGFESIHGQGTVFRKIAQLIDEQFIK